ncbi:hypothetical protein H6F76_09215 [Leptolyngbya sp. FACHB-321]|uniref:hypothetical protein n=1 Tax=Leptolyngbya sp. FACHB-321 TaxID=2692807 RepID=UPI001689EF41|nr:hypothetical protein [Leptolyngbya sp. FACHB-321]MBD2035206.1 hypothetical protein [Leptolyngbya sp. FACHB-321]
MKSPALIALSLVAFFSGASAARADALAAPTDNGGAIDLSLGTSTPATLANATSPAEQQVEKQVAPTEPTTPSNPTPSRSPALSFDPPVVAKAATVPAPSPPPVAAPVASTSTQADLFTGGSDSLVARTVGHAEGTRTPNGSKTRAYYGHSDPGNGVWNMGSFSYQHGADSPEAADEKQLRRLERQAEVIRQKADAHRLNLSLEEELNAIDLANQAPLAALDTPGYIEWLKKARDRGLTGSEAVLWARTQSYWNPRRNRWEAPGLGNTEDNISHDQNRRLTAIARALDVYQQQTVARRKEEEPQIKVANKPPQEAIADQIIFQNLAKPQPSTNDELAATTVAAEPQ